MNTKEAEDRFFVPIVWFALICWFALIYFWPYAAVLPLVIGGIVELFWPYSERKIKPTEEL